MLNVCECSHSPHLQWPLTARVVVGKRKECGGETERNPESSIFWHHSSCYVLTALLSRCGQGLMIRLCIGSVFQIMASCNLCSLSGCVCGSYGRLERRLRHPPANCKWMQETSRKETGCGWRRQSSALLVWSVTLTPGKAFLRFVQVTSGMEMSCWAAASHIRI